MVSILLALLMGVWRRVDGSSYAPKFWHLFPILLFYPIYYLYGLNTLGAFIVAYIAMLDGFHGWHDFGYMRMRFTGYCAISCALFSISPIYMIVGFLVGMMWPLGKKYKIPKYTEYAEFICGVSLVAGAILL